MAMRLNPYVSFRDTARQALEHWHEVLGGTLDLTTFGEAGMEEHAPAHLLMHGRLETAAGFTVMAADTPPGMDLADGSSISVSLSGDHADAETLRGYWAGLAEGGTVQMPLERAPWGDDFGMLTDRFGIAWMVNIAGA